MLKFQRILFRGSSTSGPQTEGRVPGDGRRQSLGLLVSGGTQSLLLQWDWT